MSFKSLLPANFNNFLYVYSNNTGHMVDYSKTAYNPGIGSAVGETIADFVKRVGTVFEKGSSNSGFL